MKSSPAGEPQARGAGCPPPSILTHCRPAIAAAGVLLALLTGAPALAEESEAIEWSVPARLVEKSLLLGTGFAEGVLAVVGERGHILISNDAGATWRQAKVPTRATLTGAWFHDKQRGWAVGHDSVIVRTTDGGTTWERVHWAPEDESPFLDVLFVDEKRGYAIGAYGAFYTSDDGGATWNAGQVVEGDDSHLNQIALSASGKLYIAAEAGALYRSDDRGATWLRLEAPYDGSFFGVLPLEGEAVLVFGLRGHMLRSEDSGATWTAVETGTVAMLNAGVRLEDGTIVVVGLGGTVLVSRDGGRTFENHPQANRAGIQAVADLGEGKFAIVGDFGVKKTSLAELTARAGR